MFTVICFSQESNKNNIYEINYELITDVNGSKIVTDYLLFTKERKSIYMTKKNFEKINKNFELKILKDTSAVKEEINSVVRIDTKNHLFFVVKDFEKDSIIFTNFADNKSYKIIEKNINFNWEFSNEEKVIDSIKCKKATANFRGRNFTAWYSESIPIFDGPFKFNGVPGLIIEIYDSEQKYYWLAKSIKLNKMSEAIIESKIDYPIIDIKTSVKLTDEDLLKLVKINQSRIPKGAKSEDLVIKRGGIELIYEWE